MASPASTETIEIRRRGRRRLIGAIAIVVLLVVFVPMLLDTDPHRPANEPAMKIPSPENAAPLPAPAKVPPKPAPQAAAVKPQAAKPAPHLEGFAVQVGAFRDEETLRQARAKLTAAGIVHYTERLDGGLTRLRAGPFPTREAAENARVALKLAALEGQVVPLP